MLTSGEEGVESSPNPETCISRSRWFGYRCRASRVHSADERKMSSRLFECRTLDELQRARPAILATVRSEAFAIVRGLVDRDALRRKLPSVYAYANNSEHRGSAGVSSADVRENMSKWSIGGHSATQNGIARFMLMLYNPLFKSDIFGLHAEFNGIIAVRDLLAGRQLLTDRVLAPTRFNGCRIQIYPAGGGFMGQHTDKRGVENLNSDEAFIQVSLLLSERGTDFAHGGGFVTRKSERIISEEDSLTGDMIVYDGSTSHGVQDVDPTVSFDANNLRGRAIALATIYTVD
jgi:hypothetical protein